MGPVVFEHSVGVALLYSAHRTCPTLGGGSVTITSVMPDPRELPGAATAPSPGTKSVTSDGRPDVWDSRCYGETVPGELPMAAFSTSRV